MKKGDFVILDFSKSRPFWVDSEAKMDKFHNQIGTLFKTDGLWSDIGNYWWVRLPNVSPGGYRDPTFRVTEQDYCIYERYLTPYDPMEELSLGTQKLQESYSID